MSYVVLARKYRPQSFEDVVGQNPVSQTLLNAINQGRVAHAYVFSGPRGVGKTTTARILAKCLNCVKGPTTTPCNKCDSCQAISTGTSLDDVLEIDGASNRGIEQIRELRESAKYAPARSRYRIYIIDEAHQITKDAFGALLKTLEEPPPHVVFMMATTEAQKIPSPILSRCQRFTLRPISPELVFKHLQEICKKEKVKVSDDALAAIVRFVEGSLRDALSLLDQALVFSPTGITGQTVQDLLGLLPKELIRNFANTILEGDPASILKQISGTIQEGIDLTQLAKDLQAYYHTLLLAKAGVEDSFKLDTQDLHKEATKFDYAVLERNIRLLARALDDMRHSETPRAVFEVYALRLGQKTLDPKALLERLEKLALTSEAGKGPDSPQRVGSSRPSPSQPSLKSGYQASNDYPAATATKPGFQASSTFGSPTGEATPRVETSQGAIRTAGEEMNPAGETHTIGFEANRGSVQTPGPLTEDSLKGGWGLLIEEIAKTKAMLGSALEESMPSLTDGRLTLAFKKSFHMDLVKKSLDVLQPFFHSHFGSAVSIDTKLDVTVSGASAKPGASSASSQRPAAPAARRFDPPSDDHDVFEDVAPAEAGADVQKALKHFPGVIKRERKN